MKAIVKIQAQQAQQNANIIQQLSQAQQSSMPNNPAQLLAILQQQQESQFNQFQAMLQQYQQSGSNCNPSQYLAQSQQQNQQMMDMLSQMQSNAAPGAGVDWASLAGGSGMDTNSLMSMMGGLDPVDLTTQSSGFMIG
jgi:hypothetical protein